MCLKIWGLRCNEQLSGSFSVRWGELDPLVMKQFCEDGNEGLIALK